VGREAPVMPARRYVKWKRVPVLGDAMIGVGTGEGDDSMRILVIGATGTIGRAVVAALSSGNEIVPVSRQSTAITVDLADPASIREMYRSAGK